MEQTEREKKEQAYITQLKKNMNPEDVAGLYHLYQKLTEKSYFRTDVGFGFLAELRDYLLKNGYQIDAYTMPQSQANKKRYRRQSISQSYDFLIRFKSAILTFIKSIYHENKIYQTAIFSRTDRSSLFGSNFMYQRSGY